LIYLSTMQDEIKEWLGSGSINIFGMPFAGKDTQGKKLAELFDGNLMGGGDILRGSSDQLTEADKLCMRDGTLISSEDYSRIVLPYLSKKEFADKPLILSSVGRWLGEEKGVLKATLASDHDMKMVVFLNLTDKHVEQRWNAHKIIGDRGDRHDDTLEILKHRLKEFHNKTMPVIEEYRKLGLLEEIDGELSRDEVTAEILRRLASRAST